MLGGFVMKLVKVEMTMWCSESQAGIHGLLISQRSRRLSHRQDTSDRQCFSRPPSASKTKS